MDGVIARRVRYGSLSVVEAGDRSAPSLALLHGIGSSGDAILSQADLQLGGLADRWRLLAPDAPGYGASDDSPEAPGLDGFADAVARLLGDDRYGLNTGGPGTDYPHPHTRKISSVMGPLARVLPLALKVIQTIVIRHPWR